MSDSIDGEGEPLAQRAARLASFERAVGAERGAPVIRLLPRDPALNPEVALNAMLTGEENPLRDAVHPDWDANPPWPPYTVDDLEAIDPATARQVLWLLLRHDMAYSSTRISIERADELTAGLLSVAGPETRWWTNGAVQVAVPYPNTGQSSGGWTPLTRATFDGGIIGVDTDAILILWLMDED